jgi:uncharacterized protein (DUF4415 family)
MRRKKGNIVSYSLEELRRMPSRTDWSRVDATTQAEVEAQIASDPDDWLTDADAVLIRGMPPIGRKERVNIRLDRDVLDFFRSHGRGYQTRINAVLRAYTSRAPSRHSKMAPKGRRKAAR